jgi:hypothetical protein
MSPKYWPDPVARAVETATGDIQARHVLALWCRYVQGMAQERAAIVCEVENRYKYVKLLMEAETAIGKVLGVDAYRKPRKGLTNLQQYGKIS